MKADSDKKTTPKDKILDATLKLIGSVGIQHITCRSYLELLYLPGILP